MLFLYQNESGELKVYKSKRARKGTMFLGGYSLGFLTELLIQPVVIEDSEEELVDLVAQLHQIEEQERKHEACEDSQEKAAKYLMVCPEEHNQKLQDSTKDFIQWSL